jgi:hypothetical protein
LPQGACPMGPQCLRGRVCRARLEPCSSPAEARNDQDENQGPAECAAGCSRWSRLVGRAHPRENPRGAHSTYRHNRPMRLNPVWLWDSKAPMTPQFVLPARRNSRLSKLRQGACPMGPPVSSRVLQDGEMVGSSLCEPRKAARPKPWTTHFSAIVGQHRRPGNTAEAAPRYKALSCHSHVVPPRGQRSTRIARGVQGTKEPASARINTTLRR